MTEEPKEFGSENFLEIMGLLRVSIDNTTFLLENLLNWAMSQRGVLTYMPEIIHLNELIEENISIFLFAAKEKNITISSNKIDDQVAFSDRNMINLIIRNLISNAIKFTRIDGEIQINAITNNKTKDIVSLDNVSSCFAGKMNLLIIAIVRPNKSINPKTSPHTSRI